MITNPTLRFCSCGGLNRTVFYSPYYKGLGFGCSKARFCRSQDEGDFETETSAQHTLAWYAAQGFRVIKPIAPRIK